ncbi:hypothetical protein GCM10027341_34820 [Spirosoma knui]
MFKLVKIPAFCRLGALCLIVFALTVTSCQPEPVQPKPQVETNNTIQDDDDDDHPPKDVDDGKKP